MWATKKCAAQVEGMPVSVAQREDGGHILCARIALLCNRPAEQEPERGYRILIELLCHVPDEQGLNMLCALCVIRQSLGYPIAFA